MIFKRVIRGAALALVATATTACSAAWTSIDDFESLTPGAIGSQGGWTTELSPSSQYTVVADPDDPTNQALRATGTSGGGAPDDGNAYISLGGNSVADGETSTLFFRIRASDESNFVFGASDLAVPTTWSSYEGYMVMDAAGGSNTMRVRDGGSFSSMSLEYEGDEWYNVWLVLDHVDDEVSLYASQGGDAADFVVTGDFRTGNGPDGTLVTLNVRMGGSHNTPTPGSKAGYLDDLFIISGVNLSNPIPEPASLGLLAMVTSLGCVIRRRR